ncbi:MAG: hypothetical protein GY772_27975 [bacterium]|nr:hypothetical protein [bacterium]
MERKPGTMEPISFHSYTKKFWEEVIHSHSCVAALDLTCGPGYLAEACLDVGLPCVALVQTPQHEHLVKRYLFRRQWEKMRATHGELAKLLSKEVPAPALLQAKTVVKVKAVARAGAPVGARGDPGAGGSAPAGGGTPAAAGGRRRGTSRDRGRGSGGDAATSSGNAGGTAAAKAGGPTAAEREAAALLAAIGKLAPPPRTAGKARATAATGPAAGHDDPDSGVSDAGAAE